MDEDTERKFVETTTGSPEELLQRLIIEKRDMFMEYKRLYLVKRELNSNYTKPLIQMYAYMSVLFDEVYSSFVSSRENGAELLELIERKDYDSLMRAFRLLGEWLYEKGLTKFDRRGGYDRTRTEIAGEHFGR